MPFYENVFIARQDISQPQVETLTETFSKVVEEHGGKVSKTEAWGLRNLSYKIKKNRKGHYVLLNVDAPPAAVEEMERQMRIHEDVIRYLTVRVDALEDGPSAMMQRREGRDDRGRRHHGGRGRPAGGRWGDGGGRGVHEPGKGAATGKAGGDGPAAESSGPAAESSGAAAESSGGDDR